MINLLIPGNKKIIIKYVVFDYNGTIALDGIMNSEIKEKMVRLSNEVEIYVITSDTNGTVLKQCEKLPIHIEIFDKKNAAIDKRNFVEKLGSNFTATIGNGRNDLEMFKSSELSIAVIGNEGCYAKTLLEADIVVNNSVDAIDLLLNLKRLQATIRS